jgi:uncharacterized protein (TIGR02117 family)
MGTLKATLLLFIITACSGCAAPLKEPSLLIAADHTASFYLVNHGWHTGLLIRRTDIPQGVWPESANFPAADYLEVGWGDRDFYQAHAFDPGLALKAILFPTASVLHVRGFRSMEERYFPGIEIIELKTSPDGLERLIRYIHETYDREGAVRAPPLSQRLFDDSRFYPAHGKFHLFNTCNTWTARALQAAGYPLTPSIRAEPLMAQARRIGRVIHSQAVVPEGLPHER